ncbi:MAG: hypothetical protein KatS3mg091_547 [Patescibacteria group bacterium]|nr:MAG: hypothetical protein KatS3mg091_547 [Patescibacteria group bacterium]
MIINMDLKHNLMVVKLAVVSVLKQKVFAGFFAILSVVFFLLSVFLPALLARQSIFIQFSILSFFDYLSFGIFAVLSSLCFVLFVYSIVNNSSVSKKAVSGAGVGVFSGLFSAVLASTTCSYCLLAIFGFLGSGFSFFLLDHRVEILFVALILLISSIFFLSKKIIDGCVDCQLN